MTLADRETVVLAVDPPIATVRLNDSEGRNRFSGELLTGVIDALERAAADPAVRAVVLEGLPEVFCAGGSVQHMLGDHEHRIVPAWQFLRSVLDCPIPVVAAAQGHAIGGGLLLALYCDAAVLSERSRYAVNFLTYGFTPVLGATFLLPTVMGTALGTEMLYSGRGYCGRELAARGAGVAVAAHDKVRGDAHRLAGRIAQAPRGVLETVKRQVRLPVLDGALAALEREIPAHEKSIGSAEARDRIRLLHGELAGRTTSTGETS